MSDAVTNEDDERKRFGQPYTSKHPVPTVQKYREVQAKRKDSNAVQDEGEGDDKVRRAYDSAKAILTGEDKQGSDKDPYPSASRNTPNVRQNEHDGSSHFQQNGTTSDVRNGDENVELEQSQAPDSQQDSKEENNNGRDSKDQKSKSGKSATENAAAATDVKDKRKAMKKKQRGDGGREVTDPVTHLPVLIYDATEKDLKRTRENFPASGTEPRTHTGLRGATKDPDQLDAEQDELQRVHDGTQQLFPPPSYREARTELTKIHQLGFTAGLSAVAASAILAVIAAQLFGNTQSSWRSPVLVAALIAAAGSIFTVAFVRSWISKKVRHLWDDEVWDMSRQREQSTHEADAIVPESVAWLNSFLSSVWPLINPDLFTSLADMLEDVMQASIPSIIRMVAIDDLGQGSEAIRILGVRWLPTGAASQTVDEEGNLKSANQSQQESNDRSVPGEGEQDNDEGDKQSDGEQSGQDLQEGLEAEQGDFVNMELAFAYRARSSGKSLMAKAKNAHLFLKFYLPGGIAVPVWVETRGAVGKMRVRMQLTPDPPFVSLCTITFMGQPKVDVSCIPISKHALNIMDVPLISSFVQSSIDAALAEYVAPKSLTLDLKDMLVGDDFKKDTASKGVVVILIQRARGYKEGDAGIGPMQGSSDTYATVSWGKFGKPAASTRVIVGSQEPDWEEWSNILVSPEELNAEEKLRIQLWDSDKFTADDDLGRVEVDLHELMHNKESRNRFQDREDRLMGEDADEKMPGTLTWRVGYFAKTHIMDDQLERQKVEPDLKTLDDIKKRAAESAERKLREAKAHQKELEQQKAQDFKELQDELMTASPPPRDYPSGIFSIQVHNITGLEVQQLQKRDNEGQDKEDQSDQAEDLPSSYATIIINHQKVYRTRTKPKNAKPFFNAGTERFVRDWQTAEVMVSVRDDRERENDALLGVVYLPLRKVFQNRSQVVASWPLAGGMGYGRVRISMVWRSVELQWPRELLGWAYGTLEVKSPINGAGQLEHAKMRLRTNISSAKMNNNGDEWNAKHGNKQVFLAVKSRYASALVLEYGKGVMGQDPPAFSVLWLKDIPDEEDTTVKLQVYKSGKGMLKRATTSCHFEGDSIGEVEMTLKFWRGLSGYHKKYANKGKNVDMRQVMEVLDTGVDDESSGDEESDVDSSADEEDETRQKLKPKTNQDSDDEDEDKLDKLNPIDKVGKLMGSNASDDGSRGLFAQARDYKDHHRQLHRKHRGVMQWKAARTLDWAVGK